MTLNTADLQRVCVDLVEVLKLKLCHPASRSSTGNDPHPDLVELIAQQYFMGTLSRLISIAKSVGNDQTSLISNVRTFVSYFPFPKKPTWLKWKSSATRRPFCWPNASML